jgi:hypothetical protein
VAGIESQFLKLAKPQRLFCNFHGAKYLNLEDIHLTFIPIAAFHGSNPRSGAAF